MPSILHSASPARRVWRLALLTSAIACAGFANAQPPGQAQVPSDAANQTAFAVPAQPLDAALAALARQAGVRIDVDAADVQGVEAAAVSGTMGIDRALSMALAGTGFGWRQAAPGDLVVERLPQAAGGEAGPAQAGEIRLSPLRVEGAVMDPATDDVSTENTGSYTTSGLSMMRGGSLRETPHSTSVVTRQLMDDRNLDTLEEAVAQTTGATVLQIDAARSNMFFRGFSLDTIQLDGVAVAFASNFATAPDLFAYDRVEVVRGPAGLFQGAGEPAAGVNLARKRALDHQQFIAGISGGSFGYKRVEADATGPLGSGSALRARLLGSYEDRNSFIDNVSSKKPMVYGTVEADVAPDTTLSFGLTWQQVDYVPFAGLPAFADGTQADVPRSRFIGASWNNWVADTADLFVEAERHPDDGPAYKFTARHVDRATDGLYATPAAPIDPETGLVRLNVVHLDYRQVDDSADAHADIPFTLGSFDQHLLVGANYREWTFDQNIGSGTPVFQDVFAPSYDAPPQTVPTTNSFVGTQRQYGAYGQARLKPAEAWTVILGGRLSWFDTDTVQVATGMAYNSTNARREFTPYGGVVFDLNPTFSLYASYADIFQPQIQSDAQGRLLEPRVGRQFETGVRASLLDGRLNGHAAIFRIEDRNRAITDPDNPLFSIAAGEVRSEGAEVEVSGQITDGWNLVAGYSYNDTEYTIASATQEGTPFRSTVPKHTANLWSRYTFDNGLSLGAGVRYSGSFYNRSGSATFGQGAYAVANAQVGYVFTRNLEATLTVNNLFDRNYYSYVNSAANGNRFGEPRFVRLSLNARW